MEDTEPQYRHVKIAALPDAPNPSSRKKEIDEAVGATAFGLNAYTLAPGEQAPWGYHYHPDHEELFYVQHGTLAVETASGTVTVEQGEAFFIPSGAPNRAYNGGEDSVAFLAVGAPKRSDRAVVVEECPDCGEDTDRRHEVVDHEGERAYRLFCTRCGAETDLLTPG